MTQNVSVATGQRVSKWRIFAWSLWDWGAASFQTVVTTFVFSVYVTSSAFGPEHETSAQLGTAMLIAGLLVAFLAPMIGRVTDAMGHRRLWLGISTAIVVIITLLMVFVAPEPDYFVFGITLLAVGTVWSEFSTVSYNAMLSQISNPRNVGAISGFGWGMGYLGGIVLLGILLVGFIFPDVGWFGVTHDAAWNIRIGMVLTAVWFAVFALPVFFAVPEVQPTSEGITLRRAVRTGYKDLAGSIKHLWKTAPKVVFFLISSAVFRDGLAGVFTFGGVIAAHSFGFDQATVIIFAIAANLVAGIATFIAGYVEHALGPKAIMLGSLLLMVVCGLLIFMLHDAGTWVFWVFGLLLCIFVGPIQSSSRSFLTRISPPGSEGEMFGLYTTTGRAVSFLSPGAFALAVALGGATIFGIIGIVVVILVGAVLLIPMHGRKELAQTSPVALQR